MQRIELEDGGVVLYQESFFSRKLVDRFFESLRNECQWEQKPGFVGHLQPRLIASYGDPGVRYKYSGIFNAALPWTDTLMENKAQID